MSPAPRTVTVFSHQHPSETAGAIRRLIEVAALAGVGVRIPVSEVEKHGLTAREGVALGADAAGPTDLAVVLGGDGTILHVLRAFAGREVPVFAFNFGKIGFLATVDHGEFEEGVRRAVDGDYEALAMPALVVDGEDGQHLAVNDVSFHRRPDGRVAELAYSVEGHRVGNVRCDGLVAATPVGSTGYNLANGGPVLAWGVEGYVVSFIAPHTLTARSLVVAPGNVLRVLNTSDRDGVEVVTDGRTVSQLRPQLEVAVRFQSRQVLLAQLPGTTFYSRFSDKFGRLSY